LRCSAISERYHEGFARAGFAVLGYDTRGFGDSEGERGRIRPQDQLEDLLSAITYAAAREDCDAERIGLFALGGIAGGNALYAAREDRRVRAVCAMSIVADGVTWFRQMRREHEWVSFKRRVEENRLRRVTENVDERVDPREDLMVATPERRATRIRHSDDVRVGADFYLSSAESLLRFRPIEAVDHVNCALLLTGVEDDVVTPMDHAEAIYERARPPKRLVRQVGVKHYDSYSVNFEALLANFSDWFRLYCIDPRHADPAGALEASVITI
jgi:alpha-beta hydrolase superfamily lysophospholipase